MPWRRSGKDPESGTVEGGTQMKNERKRTESPGTSVNVMVVHARSRSFPALSALIIPLQQIIGHPVENLCPFAERAQSVARFFGQLLSNPPGPRQAHNGRKGGFFGSDIFSGTFA